MVDRLMPQNVEERLRDLALEVRQRQRIRGITRFGLLSAVLTAALGALFYLLEGTPVPLVVPVALYLAGLAAAWYRWVRRAVSTVTREQLALYLDEQFPELENAFVSGATLGARAGIVPDWVIDRFHVQLREATASVALPHLFSGETYRRVAINGVLSTLAGLAAVAIVISLWDADRLADGMLHGLRATRSPFTVDPGSVRIVRGADQTVWLRTGGDDVVKAIRWREAGGPWQTDPLAPGRAGGVYYHAFRNVQADIDYEIRVGGAHTEAYTLAVWTPPEVVRVDLLCRYPGYLDLPPRPVAYDASVRVPVGSTLEFEVTVNKQLAEVRLLRAGSGVPVDLVPGGDRAWTGSLDVGASDTLRILLRDADGESAEDPRSYVVTALEDRAPEMQVRAPRGDGEATAIEEIPFTFTVKDDYGLTDYGLRLEIPGQDPVVRSLKPAESDGPLLQAEITHLLPLEDLDLRAGDFVVWSVWAKDGRPGRDALAGAGDPYFLEIRPYLRRYSRAVSDEEQVGRQGGQDGDPSQRQKQVLIATWNLRREASRLDEREFEARRGQIIEAQLGVLEGATGAGADPRSRDLLEELQASANAAAAALRDAPYSEPGSGLADAIRHEQRAYRALLRLRPAESQVTRSRRARGSGSGALRSRDVEGLEMDARRDFREEATTLDEQLAETEQIRNAIEDLARRQQAINDDVADLISEQPDSGAQDPASKRRLEQLREEQRNALAELDRLQGEVASGGLDPQQGREARERLEEARGQMGRGADHLQDDDLQRARAAGTRALGALDDVGRKLQQLSREAAADRLRDLQERLEALRDEQRGILEATRRQETESGPRRLDGEKDEADLLLERKRALAESFEKFMNEAGELADRAHGSQELMAQRLGDWLRETAKDGIYEDIQKGENYIRYGAWDVAGTLEEDVAARMARASERLEDVAGDLVEDDLAAMRRAVQELERLLAAADSAGYAPDPGENDGSAPRPTPHAGSEAGWGGAAWDGALRTAEALLPEGSESRRRVTGAREEMTALDRRYRRSERLPARDIVVGAVFGPLAEVVTELRREIENRSSSQRIASPDSRAIPERYRQAVADYFRRLSEMGR